MTPLRINVTARDIAKGLARQGSHCPVAHALKRRFGEAAVCREWLNISSKGMIVKPLPPGVLEFVDAFDAGLPVKPFRFTLQVPDSWRKKK